MMKTNHFQGFSGLRVYAISMVLACHVQMLSPSSGGIGNKIFFTLSGFLAYFSLRSMGSFTDVLTYYKKKICRILPSYYLLLLLAAACTGILTVRDIHSENSLLLNMVFVKNYAHLWFLQQIMLMYLVSPLFLLLHRIVKKLCKSRALLYSAGILFVLAVLEKRYLTADIFRLSGEGSHAQFCVWMFMIGFSCACVYEECAGSTRISGFFAKPFVMNAMTGILVMIVFMQSVFVIPRIHDHYLTAAAVLESEMLRTFLACIIIFILAITPGMMIKRILEHPVLRTISDCSFEIYIIHFFVIPYIGIVSPKLKFVLVYMISFVIGHIVHALVGMLQKRRA